MLVLGWSIERTKEGETQGFHKPARRISQSGQVKSIAYLQIMWI